MMSVDTVKNLIKKAMRQAGDEICFAFQGGEPTLRGLDFFREVIRLEREVQQKRNPCDEYDFRQTGLLLTKSGAGFLKNMIF